MFPLVVTVLTVLVFLDLSLPGQERCHWMVLVRIRLSVTKLDVNDGVDLNIPYTLDNHPPLCVIVLVTTLTYLLLGSGTALMS